VFGGDPDEARRVSEQLAAEREAQRAAAAAAAELVPVPA
jgi:hypothetical protein